MNSVVSCETYCVGDCNRYGIETPPHHIITSTWIISSDFYHEKMLKLDNSISNNIFCAFDEMEKSSQIRAGLEEISMQKGHVADAMTVTMTKPTE